MEFAPLRLGLAIGDDLFRNESLQRGPGKAKGVIVWRHGYSGRCNDQRAGATRAILTRFRLAGWDVLRFDRDPCLDGAMDRAMSRLAKSVPKLRAAAYGAVALAGKSR